MWLKFTWFVKMLIFSSKKILFLLKYNDFFRTANFSTKRPKKFLNDPFFLLTSNNSIHSLTGNVSCQVKYTFCLTISFFLNWPFLLHFFKFLTSTCVFSFRKLHFSKKIHKKIFNLSWKMYRFIFKFTIFLSKVTISC